MGREKKQREREKGKGRIRSLSSRGNVYGRVMRKERKRRAEGEKEKREVEKVTFPSLYSIEEEHAHDGEVNG